MINQPTGTKIAYTKAELATAVGVSEATIDREIKAGNLEVRYVRGKVVIMYSEAIRWLESCPTEKEL